MKPILLICALLLSAVAAMGQARTAERAVDVPFSQLNTNNPPNGSMRHVINGVPGSTPCTGGGIEGTGAIAIKLGGVWYCPRLTVGVGTGDVVGGDASSVGEMPLYTDTSGTSIGRSNTLSGIALLSSGVVSVLASTGTGNVVRSTSPTIATPTLTTPVITSFSSSQHTHEAAASGGQLNASNVFSAGTIPPARVISGTIINDRCMRVNNLGQIAVASDDCGTGGGSGTPGGVPGNLAFNEAGSFGGAMNTSFSQSTGVLTMTQKANGNDTLNLLRFTDTTPTGTLLRLRNAANNADLFSVSATGALNLNSTATVALTAAPATPASGFTVLWTDSTTKNLRAQDDAGNVSGTVRAITCSGNDKVSAISSAGVVTCTADQEGSPGAGITTLNALTATTQSFVDVDDTNVTLTIGSATSTHTFTIGWVSTLAKARQNAATGYTDQSNTWSTGAQDFTSATSLTVPRSAGAAPTVNGQWAYDESSDTMEYGAAGINRTVANTAAAQTFSNKTLDNSNAINARDTTFTLQDNSDPSKTVNFELGGLTASTNRVVTIANAPSVTVQPTTLTTNQFVTHVDSAGVVQKAQPSFSNLSGSMGPTQGGTGQTTTAQGDLLYSDATNSWARLPKSTTATHVLTNTGASNSPAWAQVSLTTGVTGSLPDANIPNNITIDLATLATTATTANAGDSATAFFSSGILEATIGGTGNAFTAFTGPATSTKTFTLPNASATILTSNTAVTVAQGGTGVGTLTGIVQGNGTGNLTALNSSTVGQVLRVTGSNAFAWGALDLGDTDAVAGSLPDGNIPNNITIDLATVATTANAGDSATAFFSTGTIEPARLGSGSGGATKFLREDSTWQTLPGGGDMLLGTVQVNTALKTFDPGTLKVGGVSTPPTVVPQAFFVDTDTRELFYGVDDTVDFWGEVFVAGLTTIDLASANVSGTLTVDKGGTGVATTTAYSPVITGTSATGPWQVDLGPGASGQCFISGGPGALPVWSTCPGGSITGGDTEMMFFDGTNQPSGDPGATYNKTTNTLTVEVLATNGANAGSIELEEGTAPTVVANRLTFAAPADAPAAGLLYILPSDTPTNGEQMTANISGTTVTLSWDTAGAGGSGDAVSVNGSAATDANFVATTASGTVPSVTWALNTGASPDAISIATVGAASASEAGVLTTGTQTIAGAKTFTGTLTFSGSLVGSGAGAGYLELAEGSPPTVVANRLTFTAPADAPAGGLLYVLPADTPTNGEQLTANISGATVTLSWDAAGAGSGISSLEGQTGATQTFTDDTNVTMVSGSNAHVITWSGTLAVARGGLGVGTVTGILQGNGTSAVTGISNSSTVGQTFRVTGASTYAWGALDLADTDAVTGILPAINGGTGNGFTAFTGPASTTKTFTLPNATATILTTNAAVTVAQGGSGVATLTGILQGNGTSAITGISNSSTVGQVFRVTGASTYAWGALDLADTDAVTGLLPDGNIAASIARDSEINVQGTASEITSSGSGVAPTLSLASSLNLSGKILELPNGTTLTGADCDAAGEAGRIFIDTDASSGQQIYVCQGTGGWILQGDGGGGGAGDVTAASNFGTDNMLIRSDGTLKGVQSSAVTIDDSNNISTAGTISSGVGGSAAGTLVLTEGTAPSAAAANTIQLQAPADVTTAYDLILPAATSTGFLLNTTSGAVGTISMVASTGSGNVARVTSTTLTTPAIAGATGTAVQDYSGALFELPNGTTLTGTDCDAAGEAGRIFIDTDATTGQQIYVCQGASGWVLQGDGGGGGGTINTGVTNVIPKYTAATTIDDSLLSDDGTTLTYGGTGTGVLGLIDTNQTHYLNITPGTNLTANRTFTITTADADTNVTFPVTGTLATLAGAEAFTNKTIDDAGTGNTITLSHKVFLPAAGCSNTTASSFWDLFTATPAVAACVTGTVVTKGVLDFADTSGGFTAQTTLLLPSDFSGVIDADIKWTTTATSGNVEWSLATICTATAATETDDPAAFNTASTVVTAAAGVANRVQTSSIASLTITGCAANELLHVRAFRDGNDAQDTLTATVRLIGIELTVRRAQ